MSLRSRNRNATTLVVDVRTSPQAYSEKVASSSTVQCHVESSSCLRNNSSMASNGSRKRPHREVDEFSGITPVVHRLSLDSSHQSSSGFNDINSINTHAKVRSAPSTPSKSGSNAGRMSSKWSLSKLDTKTSLREDSVTSIEVGEPPSKMRRIYGFMRRLVGFGLGNGQ
ncbi:hypothetical protein DICVIV_05703 [Dictyocaulus viviparus]|uniref:Uncharacterized protein n=1 Tax=Dictyocaulus viviparus TaxID=29172 RepID=A0A0D8XUL1_DICVI|nr:hypothetical protein DICVIV_05703 [Dictyocaulus viviparus]